MMYLLHLMSFFELSKDLKIQKVGGHLDVILKFAYLRAIVYCRERERERKMQLYEVIHFV